MALGSNSQKNPVGGVHSNSNTADDAGGGNIVMAPPTVTLRLWSEVANGIDKSQTVVWKNAVDSLQEASQYLLTSPDARRFVEGHMRPVISILLEQQPSKIGQMEKNCVEDSLRLAVTIVAEDLKAKADPAAGDCEVLDVLAAVFNRKKIFYKGSKPSWNVNLIGLPEVRQGAIQKFRNMKGFSALATYLAARVKSDKFPQPDVLHQLLTATVDVIPSQSSTADSNPNTSGAQNKARTIEDEALRLAQAVMDYMGGASEETLKRQAHDNLNMLRYDVQRIFEKLAPTRRKEAYAFYDFWRVLTLKLITSQSLPLKLFGWEQVGEIIESSGEMRPPPKAFIVEGAGCTFVDGRYVYAGPLTEDGFARPQSEISYVRKIPNSVSEKEGRGKTLTLFRCTMRSHQKWWFLSEADEEQPGTDKDIDYYSHKSKAHEESEPPLYGWTTCRNSGIDPPPTLSASGLMVPNGEEYNTLEHQLAKWAIENKVIELVLGDSAHREVVARSVSLIKFLASMCERDETIGTDDPSTQNGLVPNAYCLKASHLLLAWKTCTSKADAAVSAEVYQLLVSILPSLPDHLAIQLLSAIQESLSSSTDKRDYLFEVAEFCSALSSTNHVEADSGNGTAANPPPPMMTDKVRAEVLKLMWAILTHPDASSLKSYDRLKTYVTNELRVDPMGKVHRGRFLGSCEEVLRSNAKVLGLSESIDEILALRMIRLTRFVLEACPSEHAISLVTKDDSALAKLLFQELSAYLKRRSASSGNLALLKKASSNIVEMNHTAALTERLNILRYAYGLSESTDMTTEQLDHLWHLCFQTSDREALMVFLANASYNDAGTIATVSNDPAIPIQTQSSTSQTVPVSQTKKTLSPALSENVRMYAFQNLFCSTTVNWEELGEGAYQSFQMLFKGTCRGRRSSPSSNGLALDALWNVCLHAGNDNVASQAMKDLLAVYSTILLPGVSYVDATESSTDKSTRMSVDTSSMAEDPVQDPIDSPPTTDPEDSFVKRIYDYLDQVKSGLESGDVSSELSAERCLRILNAAVGHDSSGPNSTHNTPSTLPSTLSCLPPNATVTDILRSVPHGMRGRSCYRTLGIVAKRPPPPVPAAASVPSQGVRLPSVLRFQIDVHPLETLGSIKAKIAAYCHHSLALVKPTNITGRPTGNVPLNVKPDHTTVSQLGLTSGCEMIVFLAANPLPDNSASATGKVPAKRSSGLDLSGIFEASDDAQGSANHFFDTLLAVLEALPFKDGSKDHKATTVDAHKLVWDLLLAMPTNAGIVNRVRSAAHCAKNDENTTDDKMVVDTPRRDDEWSALLNVKYFHRSVYIMQVIDSFLQPAPEILSCLPDSSSETSSSLGTVLACDAMNFRTGFIDSGGFDAVLRLFTGRGGGAGIKGRRTRMGYAVALRILKSCFFGGVGSTGAVSGVAGMGEGAVIDDTGKTLLLSLEDPKALLMSLTSVVVSDKGVSEKAILDVLQLLRLLLLSDARMTDIFAALPNGHGETFLMTLLLWECGDGMSTMAGGAMMTVAAVQASTKVRRKTEELILLIPSLSRCALPWLIKALESVDTMSDSTTEFFSVLKKLVEGCASNTPSGNFFENSTTTDFQLRALATALCIKLGSHPRPTSDSAAIDFSTGVLCGCLKLLRALIESAGGAAFKEGAPLLLKAVGTPSWVELNETSSKNKGMLDMISSSIRGNRGGVRAEDAALIDLMGAIFDGFLSSAGTMSPTSICCDKDSRQLGFDVISSAAQSCDGGEGYLALVTRAKDIISLSAPSLRHRWSLHPSGDDGHHTRLQNTISKYSGLRNQGCTCYMNSVLQQLFMMSDLRKNLCSATLPSSLRSFGSGVMAKGSNLIGKKIAVHWESGVSYDAVVEGFNESTGMHTIRYCPPTLSGVGHQPVIAGGGAMSHHQSHHQQQIRHEDIAALPEELPEEFFLSEGRPGKETGVFDILPSGGPDDAIDDPGSGTAGESSREGRRSSPKVTMDSSSSSCDITETEDEASSRRLLEEVQRTFVHLEEGSRGRCFDPRSLVEASGCLKLEFDVWQQNDASEFAMKLLDRLEVCLKRWAPRNFKYLTHTFGLKQTKQKICKECKLKTNREENLMNIDCQIRGKSDIHEALSTMCEVEFMEGDNKVFCDRCKRKTDTVLRTAISTLPDVLVLSLKRFDLDYTTFETVKLNSRCAFDQTLNMKRYTLEGVEAMEKANTDSTAGTDDAMDTGDETVDYSPIEDPLSSLPDEDYEYKLVGVLVHAGVAQGGHYYSFIKDRTTSKGEDAEKWYRFDDEDVTPFDPSSIEVECFGGKVKKETKWPNGTVHSVESEQFANALMLFYEKVKPVKIEVDDNCPMDEQDHAVGTAVTFASGYDVFQPDVRRSNTTHCWHTFLFDAEFQSFLKGLLGLRLKFQDGSDGMEMSTPSSLPPSSLSSATSPPWHLAILQMCLSFVFDILFHSAETDVLNDWAAKLSRALSGDKVGAKWFAHELARRCYTTSDNWLRVYCTDCPDEYARRAAINVMSTAIQTSISFAEEQNALQAWAQAWKSQIEAHHRLTANKRQHIGALPTKLETSWKSHEDVKGFENGSASSLGVIVSTIATLLEVAPRLRYHMGLSVLIRDISIADINLGGKVLQKALIEAQIPARLICLAIRDRAPAMLRGAFPGSSVSCDIAEAMIKNETPPASHLLPLAGGSVGMNANTGGVVTNVAFSSPAHNMVEALSCVIGVPGAKRAPLVCEVEGSPKGRPVIILSREAKEALTIIFDESKSSEGGMGQRDIQNYMQKCGVDTSAVPPQKIASILNKYPTVSIVGSDSTKDGRYLSLEGFLAYYRDTAQSNEMQVRSDLHTFGFRQDLTRRPDEVIYNSQGGLSGRSLPFASAESVALDVGLIKKSEEEINLGVFAELGLLSFHLYSLAFSTSEHSCEYLLATAGYGKDTNKLLSDTLKTLSRTPAGWAGNDIFNSCATIMKVLVSIPDQRQSIRIDNLMKSRDKVLPHAEAGVGLIVAAKELSTTRTTQHYTSDFHYTTIERYINAIKEVAKIQKVQDWMSKNREQWAWMEHWLRSDGLNHQVRGDVSGRRDTAIHPPPAPNHHSDSDMNPGLGNDSEEDDDSHYDQVDNYPPRSKVVVHGSGTAAVNGIYVLNDQCDGIDKYTKDGIWKNQEQSFSLFRCQLSDHTRRWYISIVPRNHVPGTNKDIDFYSAPALGGETENPPERWTTAKEGTDPPPICTLQPEDEDGEGGTRMWNGDCLDDGEDFQGNSQGGRELGFL